jgi:hypothetical protein
MLFCASTSACVLAWSNFAVAVTTGSLAPHDGQPNQQWITDPRTHCIAADPNYDPSDSISWQGHCRRDGMIYGPGSLTFLNKGQVVETINGMFTDGMPKYGRVVATWSDGSKYEGDQLGDLFNGMGKFVSPKGDTLDGEWKMGVFVNGKAGVVWANGDRYDGEWKNGKPDGQGVEVWADGRRYEGEWRDGVPVGEAQASGNMPSIAATVADASNAGGATVPAAAPETPTKPQLTTQTAVPASFVAPSAPPATAANPATRTATIEKIGNSAPNPALPLRALLGTELVAVDGATLRLGLTADGFERTLVLPNGNSQEIEFAFANGPVGTVSEAEKAIGVFRAKSSELDIDYADGTMETIGEGTDGGLVDRANSADGRTICTAWYPQGHVFSQGEKQAAVQEYAGRLGLSISASSAKHHTHDATPACGGAFVASGGQQKAGTTETNDKDAGKPEPGASHASGQRAQSDDRGSPQHAASAENAIAVQTSAVHLIDAPNSAALAPAHLERASFAPGTPAQPIHDPHAAADTPPAQAGASDCLTVTSNGEYWGFQNRCAKSVQFAYCEMGDANPLTSCGHTSVSGSVAANGFSALVGDHSLAEKSLDHEFRWMACDGGAGEVVPHLDKVDPPSGRCERAVTTAN